MKNIIFDFGNVIITFDEAKVVSNFTKEKEKQQFLINNVIHSPEWLVYGLIDTGYITNEEMIDLINDRTNNQYCDLVANFIRNYYKYMYIQEEVIEIIKELKKKGYKIYLLSNTNKLMYEKYIKNIESLFDGIVLSYTIHKLKPYEAIYNKLLNKYNITPEESLFIDNNKANMETANRLKINGRIVKSDDVNDIKLVLKEFKIGDKCDRQ